MSIFSNSSTRQTSRCKQGELFLNIYAHTHIHIYSYIHTFTNCTFTHTDLPKYTAQARENSSGRIDLQWKFLVNFQVHQNKYFTSNAKIKKKNLRVEETNDMEQILLSGEADRVSMCYPVFYGVTYSYLIVYIWFWRIRTIKTIKKSQPLNRFGTIRPD